ncbi:hypothetical protein OB2597_08784 [Pseudooceanicola batsensis HTCC2597]|uniref:Uncharacterized protein n=1 Tax=Pseudooceanicola batsensis (strain ATCC BAA-863 / DSM 15984 / KCTC 12145 / HTCC2597) TaxID=252305 RepID=A3TUM9_PSEBH|nr:hypothetical protein [Pseudooceanicola batsensis]EAQ04225.1 hypothetical protein OB2597_08784 [Pseudooceanicola batsensis HTCC2597]
MQTDRPTSAPNYTNATLWMGFINLLWIFGLIWSLFGLLAVIAVGWLLNLGISRLRRT